MADRPLDACPYPRPYAEAFDDCPTYAPAPFLAMDSQHRELGQIRTCRHLEVRSLGHGQAGFYGACALGDAAARAELARDRDGLRLEGVRQLSRELGDATRDLTRQLWEIKGDQLRARRENRRAPGGQRRLKALREAYRARATEFFGHRGPRLRELDLPGEACVELLVGILDDWIGSPSLEAGYTPPPALLERFPAPVRALATPHGATAARVTSGLSRSARPGSSATAGLADSRSGARSPNR